IQQEWVCTKIPERHALGVDKHKTERLWRVREQQRSDCCPEPFRLTGTCGTHNEHMRAVGGRQIDAPHLHVEIDTKRYKRSTLHGIALRPDDGKWHCLTVLACNIDDKNTIFQVDPWRRPPKLYADIVTTIENFFDRYAGSGL